MTRRKRKNLKAAILIACIVVILAGVFAYRYYNYLYKLPYTEAPGDTIVFIPTDSDFETVIDTLIANELIGDEKAFRWVAGIKKYDTNVKPGRYRVPKGLNNDDLVDLLRSGRQEAVKLVIQEVRTLNDLAELLAKNLEPNSESFLTAFSEHPLVKGGKYSDTTLMTIFIANTYEVYWTVDAEVLIDRMYDEHERFWNKNRLQKAEAINLNTIEVYTLASIVYAETKKRDEAPVVAGLYINRLNQKMPLESDPTLIFSKGDFTIRRVLNEDKKVDSPYNTYQRKGLPPGPINMPPLAWIDAVLNYDDHNYIFMCAKEDFSGYHNFARTNREHERNAAKYRRALNQRGIYR